MSETSCGCTMRARRCDKCQIVYIPVDLERHVVTIDDGKYVIWLKEVGEPWESR